jgi:hypothetical protein
MGLTNRTAVVPPRAQDQTSGFNHRNTLTRYIGKIHAIDKINPEVDGAARAATLATTA